jgi:carboxyl-terminal processing protease
MKKKKKKQKFSLKNLISKIKPSKVKKKKTWKTRIKNFFFYEEEKENTFKSEETIVLILTTALLMFLTGFMIGKLTYMNNKNLNSYFTKEIIKAYTLIDDEYDVDDKELVKGAVKGMLNTLGDPYAEVLEPAFENEINGKFEGFGIQIITKAVGEIYIHEVFENSAAKEAGLLVGDRLIQIDDLTMDDKTGTDFANYVQNKKEKEFTLKILRDKKEKVFKLSKKETIIPSIYKEEINYDSKTFDYIRISIFSGTTKKQLEETLKTLKHKDNGLIIDLRNNSGGRLDVLEDVLSLFLDSKQVMYQTDDNGRKEKFYSKGKKNYEGKIVILTNENSASASEMLTVALKENLGAYQIGKTTYGKGTVQRVGTLNALEFKYTIKTWLSPKGVVVNKIGVKPDLEVELNEKYFKEPTKDNDNQLQAALNKLKE